MVEHLLINLQQRSDRLQRTLNCGTTLEVKSAREMLRLSLVELYAAGHWQKHPGDMQKYMRIYRSAETCVSAPASSSAPGRMARYSP
jgi:hypothetical protein